MDADEDGILPAFFDTCEGHLHGAHVRYYFKAILAKFSRQIAGYPVKIGVARCHDNHPFLTEVCLDYFGYFGQIIPDGNLLAGQRGKYVKQPFAPKDYLCPPIPGRADYIHHIADVLCSSNFGKMPRGNQIKCLDIGVGANCVYPIIGNSEYGWSFIGSDIDPIAIASANAIIDSNPNLKGQVECRLQKNDSKIFAGILKKDERIDVSVCNPPFHASLAESQAGTIRKLSNLKNKKISKPDLNFGGKDKELWTEGGEKKFILDMIKQSVTYGKSCCWFSTLVSKQSNLKYMYEAFDRFEVEEYKTIPMGQGNKTSRIVAWTFLNLKEEKNWVKARWKNQ